MAGLAACGEGAWKLAGASSHPERTVSSTWSGSSPRSPDVRGTRPPPRTCGATICIWSNHGIASVSLNAAISGLKLIFEVRRVVETMHRISDSSTKVAEIISVIEGIAFQINILALSAAVEAARGQGRGFAVVAGEVRTLAQRSAAATKEIKALIGESVNRVEAGSMLVGDAASCRRRRHRRSAGFNQCRLPNVLTKLLDAIAAPHGGAMHSSRMTLHVGGMVAATR
jgi:hypothetical protein